MFKTVKGFHDIYGKDIAYWERVENILKKLLNKYGFKEFRLPILEKTAVFNRGIGDTTDIVEKEMFSFIDNDGDSVSLRPEGTASLIRAYIENGLSNPPGIKKYFYMGNMFRRERPQKGRFRQFTQMGVEVLECDSPLLDAEIITLLYDIAKEVGISEYTSIEINSIGCKNCRPIYKDKLIDYFKQYINTLCDDCKRRLDKNPMRIIDCKKEECSNISKNAPIVLDYICDECNSHFEQVKKYLSSLGTNYNVNPRMVRGLDYYIRTAFELVTDKLGAASAVGGGGRYDGLVKLMGGGDVSGIGFAVGMDRIVSLLKEKEEIQEKSTDIFVIFFEGKSFDVGIKIVKELRDLNFVVEYDYSIASMKSQMKKANRSGAKHCIILGENEIDAGKVSIKNLETGIQVEENLDSIKDFFINK